MEVSEQCFTWNIKKSQRYEAKKRKMEALLNLFENEKDVPPKRKKEPESLVESFKALKNQLKQYTKKPPEPLFYLSQSGMQAKVNLEETDMESHLRSLKSLFSEDIYRLLLKAIIGCLAPYPMRWAHLEAPQTLCRTVLLVIEGFTAYDVLKNISLLPNMPKIFADAVSVSTPNIPFSIELSTLHEAMNFHNEGEDAYSSVFPKTSDVKVKMPENLKVSSRLHLLLSPIQLVMESYPLPQNVFQYSKSENYVFTHKSYAPVTKNSPLFAIDCEMCRTETGRSELTRIAIVDEDLEVIYHTFVKPETKIVDYMTRYSGITKEMLVGVKTTLKEVQADIQAILPKDAILCGQSLNCDLHALEMIHPYVIDTSIIFNGSGIRGKKDSLKKLARCHLKEDIQCKKTGHNPIEDAIATMKLVLLKLDNPIKFGDACFDNNDENVGSNDKTGDKVSNASAETSKVYESSEKKNDLSFFGSLMKCSKKVCIVGDADSLNNYPFEVLQENVCRITKTNVKKVCKSTLKHVNKYDFTISHLTFDSNVLKDSLLELNDFVKQVYDCCVERSMIMILFSGVDQTKVSSIKKGLLLLNLKKK